MKIYLHIGTHKTGSTSIQNVLFKNRELLIKKGFYYPEVIDNHTAQHHLAWLLVNNDFTKAEQYLNTEMEKAAELGCDSIILSSEEFEFLYGLERISFFNKFGSVQIIAMLRRQDDLIEAEYNQSVKMPTVRYSKDIYQFYIEKNFSVRINYSHVMQNWLKAYGTSSVKIVSYDLERKERSLLLNFFKLLGLNINDLADNKSYDENVSLPNNALLYLSRLNAREDITTEKHFAAIRYLSELFKGSRDTFIDSELREILLGRYRIMNANLFKEMYPEYDFDSLLINNSEHRCCINHYENFNVEIFSDLLTHLEV